MVEMTTKGLFWGDTFFFFFFTTTHSVNLGIPVSCTGWPTTAQKFRWQPSKNWRKLYSRGISSESAVSHLRDGDGARVGYGLTLHLDNRRAVQAEYLSKVLQIPSYGDMYRRFDKDTFASRKLCRHTRSKSERRLVLVNFGRNPPTLFLVEKGELDHAFNKDGFLRTYRCKKLKLKLKTRFETHLNPAVLR